jgi:hypothetical protein
MGFWFIKGLRFRVYLGFGFMLGSSRKFELMDGDLESPQPRCLVPRLGSDALVATTQGSDALVITALVIRVWGLMRS